MEKETPVAEINMSRIPVSADIAGLLFTVGTVVTFYWGIPELKNVVPAAIVVGVAVAVLLHLIRHEDPKPSYIPH